MAETIWADDMAAMLCRALFLAAWSWGDMGREGLSRAASQAQGRHDLASGSEELSSARAGDQI